MPYRLTASLYYVIMALSKWTIVAKFLLIFLACPTRLCGGNAVGNGREGEGRVECVFDHDGKVDCDSKPEEVVEKYTVFWDKESIKSYGKLTADFYLSSFCLLSCATFMYMYMV